MSSYRALLSIYDGATLQKQLTVSMTFKPSILFVKNLHHRCLAGSQNVSTAKPCNSLSLGPLHVM